jgi:hypothetical protein
LSNAQWWSTVDFTGDGKPDLVLTHSCTDPSVGTTHWLVYPNVGSGFASTPTSFALPSESAPLFELSGYDNGDGACTLSNAQWWSTVDFTGDGKPDLVLTHSCTDPSVGVKEWQVFPSMCGM